MKKSFYDWCIEHNRQDLLDRWDYELNKKSPKEVSFKSSSGTYFKCPYGKHESTKVFLYARFTSGNYNISCTGCNSFGQWGIDNICQDFLEKYWDYDKNKVDPMIIGKCSHTRVYIKCQEKDYHGSYLAYPYDFTTRNNRCPYCTRHSLHPFDSLGGIFPEIINRWSSKNIKTPYEYSPYTDVSVWLICPDHKHDDYQQLISNASKTSFRCPFCSREAMGLKKSGENSPLWKGGVHPQIRALREKRPYKNWRSSVFEKDDYTCQCCGVRGGKLNAHHIYPFSDYESLRFDINNGITLCENCHDTKISESFHNTYGTHNNTPDQLREYILNKSNIDIYKTHPEILSITIQN